MSLVEQGEYQCDSFPEEDLEHGGQLLCSMNF